MNSDDDVRQKTGSTHGMSDYWTDKRVETWERMDQVSNAVERKVNEYRDGLPIGIHTSAPNPDSISADETPDKWYWSVGSVNVEIDTIHELLSERVNCELDVRERPDGWEPGYWIVVENENEL